MKQPYDNNAWSLYWSEDRLHSCVAKSSDEDQHFLNHIWSDFAKGLTDNSNVLDLATGNGAVANALLATNRTLEIDAVDRAEISPLSALKSQNNLSTVTFHSEIDINEMSFELDSFDAITSQFGIEYAGLKSASKAALPLLKSAGRFQFIVHHSDSSLIQSSQLKITELEQLVRESGILQTLINSLGGNGDFSQLEHVGQDYLKLDKPRSEEITGQVFAGIERIIGGFSGNPNGAIELGLALDLRVRSELDRLRQLISASQSPQAMEAWLGDIADLGFTASYSPLYMDPASQGYLLAWLAFGVRRK